MTETLRCDHPAWADHAQLYELLVAELTDFAVFLIDPDGCITSWNPGVERLLGYAEAEWLGRPTHIIFTPEDRAANKPEEEMAQAAQEGRAPDIRWHQRKDGSRLFVEGTLVALKDSAGKLLGFSKVMRDVTPQVLARQELERVNRGLEEFAYVVSHDLQEPLRMVYSYSQLLARRLGDELTAEQRDFISSIQQGVKRMGQLIKDLLAYSRTVHTAGELATSEASLDKALQQALTAVETRIVESGAAIHPRPPSHRAG
jgi:PAS domain S-box-containing protein